MPNVFDPDQVKTCNPQAAELEAINFDNVLVGMPYKEGYIRFQLGGESFCLPAQNIRGVSGAQSLLPAINSGLEVVGCLFSLGRTLPVLDLRPKLNLHPVALSKKSSIVLVSLATDPRLRAGIVVEQLETTIRFSVDRVKNRRHEDVPVQFVRGLVQEGEEKIWVLDLEFLINPADLRRLEMYPS